MARLKSPTRIISNRPGGFNIIGLFWSVILERHVVFESLVEHLLFLKLERLRVQWYSEQPRVFRLRLDGRRVKYCPDALSYEGNRRVLYQGKPANKASEPAFMSCMDQFTAQLDALGYAHEIFVPHKKDKTLWLNLRMMYGYVVRHPEPEEHEDARAAVRERGCQTLGDAVALMRARRRHVGGLYAAMFYERIKVDVSRELTVNTRIGCH